MATITYFEIPADNLERARAFYGELFDWNIRKLPDMDYWTFDTTTEKGEPSLSGGLFQRNQPHQPILTYIGVPSIDEYAAKVEKFGGKVLVPKTAIPPDLGFFAICLDTEQNVFALWER